MTQLLYICGPKPTVDENEFARLVPVSPTQWAGTKNLVPPHLLSSTWEFDDEAAHAWCDAARLDLAIHGRRFEDSTLVRVLRLVLPTAQRVVVSYNDDAQSLDPTPSIDEFLEDLRSQVCHAGGLDVNAIYQKGA